MGIFDKPVHPAPPEPAPAPDAPEVPEGPPAKAGDVMTYTSHDAYGDPPGERTQIVLVMGTDEQGRVRGKALGFADEGASFAPGVLQALSD